MKRVLLLLYLLASLLLASNYKFKEITINRSEPIHSVTEMEHMSSKSESDGKIDIEIIWNVSEVTIKHLSKYTIDYAVVEYAYMEDDNVLSARLDQIPVKNNIFKVDPSWKAIKVHQIKTLIGNVYYTYSTNDNKLNSAPSSFNWNSVRRLNTVQLEQVALRKVDVSGKYVFKGQIYEVYFNFNEKHDELKAITLNYVKVRKNNFSTTKTNESERLIWNFATNDRWELGSEMERLVLNEDKTIPANYIGRFFPHISNSHPSYSVENVFIIEVEYMLDGEFIIADVITDPISPVDDAISWLLKFIETLKKIVNQIVGFFNGNASTIFKVIMVIIGLILLMPAIAIFTVIFKIIKLVFTIIFKGIGSIFSLIGILLIPKEKDTKKEYERFRR